MHSTVAQLSIATTTPNCDRNIQIRIPQRRANYNDKARIRLAKVKEIAFIECGWKSTANVKKYLQVLGIKLDLRLTSAWVALVFELKPQVDAAKAIVDALEEPQFKVGDRVIWDNAPVYIHSCWGWLPIWKIENGFAWLEMWAGSPIPVSELHIVA